MSISILSSYMFLLNMCNKNVKIDVVETHSCVDTSSKIH